MGAFHRGKRAGFPGGPGGFFPRSPARGGFFGSDAGGSAAPPNVLPTAGFTWAQTINTQTIAFTDTSSDSDGSIASWSWDFGDAGSSSLQNPTHAYTNPGSYTVTLTVTDNVGGTDDYSTSVRVVDVDGPSSVYVPTSAADFTALGLTVPDSLWLCQEASGNADDVFNAMDLTPTGSPTYAQAVTNWTRTAFGFNQTSNQRFSGSTAYDPSAASSAMLVYAEFVAALSTPRGLMTLGQTTGASLYSAFTNAGLVRITNNAVNVSGASDHRGGGVRPYLFVYNRTAGTVRVYTNLEQINGTYSATVTNSANKGFCGSGVTSFEGKILWGCQWYGAGAEAQAKATLTTLGWSLPY